MGKKIKTILRRVSPFSASISAGGPSLNRRGLRGRPPGARCGKTENSGQDQVLTAAFPVWRQNRCRKAFAADGFAEYPIWRRTRVWYKMHMV